MSVHVRVAELVGRLERAWRGVRDLERLTRPVDPEFRDALVRRWAQLPATARTAGQVLGRHGVGCEGTHGIFPRCNLACTPCYHSRDANRVRIDGPHTLAGVAAQFGLLRSLRGPRAHAQLIGGEVSLLDPDDHAAALQIMRAHGREPMSFTHGDVDDAYLDALVLGPDGRRRLDRVSFAAHFDMFMYGRRGIPRPPDEASLDAYRRRFVQQLRRLRREHGVRSFAAHNMTVTPANLEQVADVVRSAGRMGYRLLSFQPAAFVGDERRWRGAYHDTTGDDVWRQIEAGAGTPIDFRVLEHGDVRCNRTAYGAFVGGRWYPLLDGGDPRDLRVRDRFFDQLGAIPFTGTPPAQLAVQLARACLRHPAIVTSALGWLLRAVRRIGVGPLLRRRIQPVTFVMHQFMDAADVTPAWELMQQGVVADDPHLRSVQERLQACHYAMGHPETGTLVPACVQHGVLDPGENAALRVLLPLVDRPPQPGGRTDA